MLATLPRFREGVSIPDMVQRIDYYLLVGLLGTVIPAASLRKALGAVLLASGACFGIAALVQVHVWDSAPHRVHSLFMDRHQFGAWMAVLMALVAGRASWRPWQHGLVTVGLLLLAMSTTTTWMPRTSPVWGRSA